MHEDDTYSRKFNPISKIVHTDSLNNKNTTQDKSTQINSLILCNSKLSSRQQNSPHAERQRGGLKRHLISTTLPPPSVKVFKTILHAV